MHYRNKVHAVVGEDKNGNIITGTYEENSHNIVPVSDCLLEDSQCSSIIATLRDLFKSFKYKPYNEDKGTGFIRHILLRKGFSTKEIMLVIVTADVAFPSKTHFLKALKEKHPEINTIVQNVNKYNTSMVLGPRNIVLTGKGYIEDVLCGYRFRISPSFRPFPWQGIPSPRKDGIRYKTLSMTSVLFLRAFQRNLFFSISPALRKIPLPR